MQFAQLKRRDFIRLVGGAAAWPLAARGQQQVVHPLIGVLSPLSAVSAARNIAGLRSGLRDLGYMEGRSVTLAPVALGFARSIARPGGHITGMWFDYDALVDKRLEFLKLAVPAVERVGLIVNPDDPTDEVTIRRLKTATRALGMTLQQFDVRDVTKLDVTAATIGRAGVEALFIGDGPTILSARADIIAMVARLRLPAMYGFREFADAGGLMSYGYNLPDAYRQMARLVVKILKGDRPGDLPFELPTRYELIINLKTAKTIDLTISDSFVLLADEVIE